MDILRTKFALEAHSSYYAAYSALCIRTYLFFHGKKYKQIEEALIGLPVCPVLANIFMTDFEEKTISSSPKKPKLGL